MSNTTDANATPNRFDLLELDGPASPAPLPDPRSLQDNRGGLPLSSAAQDFAARMAAPESSYSRSEVQREYRARASVTPADEAAMLAALRRSVAVEEARLARARAAAEQREQLEARSVALGQSLVAGASAGAEGRLVSWRGQGSMTRGQIMARLVDAGEDMALAPAALSLHAQLGRVLTHNRRGAICRSIRKGRGGKESWRAKWQIGTISGADVDQPFGTVLATVVLAGDNYTITGDQSFADEVRAAVGAHLVEEVLSSSDVSDWLRRTIEQRFAGVALGVCMWVPSRYADRVDAICAALASSGWGESWMLPMIPVANSGQLAKGLAASLSNELREVATDYASQTTFRGGQRALERVEQIRSRATALIANGVDASNVIELARTVEETIRASYSDTEQRAALLEL